MKSAVMVIVLVTVVGMTACKKSEGEIAKRHSLNYPKEFFTTQLDFFTVSPDGTLSDITPNQAKPKFGKNGSRVTFDMKLLPDQKSWEMINSGKYTHFSLEDDEIVGYNNPLLMGAIISKLRWQFDNAQEIAKSPYSVRWVAKIPQEWMD